MRTSTDKLIEQVLQESGLLDQLHEKKAAKAAAERAALFSRAAELDAELAAKLPALDNAVKTAERRHELALAELTSATIALRWAAAERHAFTFEIDHHRERALNLAAQIGDPRITAAQDALAGMRQKILARASMARETKTDFLGHKRIVDSMTNGAEIETALSELLTASRALETMKWQQVTDVAISQTLAPLAAALADLGIDFSI